MPRAHQRERAPDESGALVVQAKTNTWVSKLGQHVADAQITHGEVSILWCAGGNEPRSAGQVRSLRDQQHSSILRVSPESLVPVDRALLNGAVVVVTGVHASKPDNRFDGCSRSDVRERVPLRVHCPVVKAELRLGACLPFEA